MSKLVGFYRDHQMTAPLAVAQQSAQVKPLAADLAKSGILLIKPAHRRLCQQDLA